MCGCCQWSTSIPIGLCINLAGTLPYRAACLFLHCSLAQCARYAPVRSIWIPRISVASRLDPTNPIICGLIDLTFLLPYNFSALASCFDRGFWCSGHGGLHPGGQGPRHRVRAQEVRAPPSNQLLQGSLTLPQPSLTPSNQLFAGVADIAIALA